MALMDTGQRVTTQTGVNALAKDAGGNKVTIAATREVIQDKGWPSIFVAAESKLAVGSYTSVGDVRLISIANSDIDTLHGNLAEEKATLAAIAGELEEALGSREVTAAAIQKMLDNATDISAVDRVAGQLQHIVGSLDVPNNISARLTDIRSSLRALRAVADAGPSYGLQK